MSVPSCLYEGEIRHRRRCPTPHSFRYRLFILCVDLDELPTLFAGRWLWSTSRPNVAWFRRADYLGLPELDLAECVRALVAERLGRRPPGPIRLLTHFRYFGFAMNPISLYYCYDLDERLDAVVAEVSNTPWNERHWYVLDARGADDGIVQARAAKEFHVSPFLEMDYDYEFQLNDPGEKLFVTILNHRRGTADRDQPAFVAQLQLTRRPLSGPNLARVLVRYPFITVRVFAAIYFQAFRLWLKRTPFVPHPDRASSTPTQSLSASKAST